MAITDLDDAVNKCSGGNNGNPQPFFLFKYDLLDAGATPGVTSSSVGWQSMWQMVGNPSHGAAPGAAANPTRATNGAIGQANAGGGRTLYLCHLSFMPQAAGGALYVADRLAHVSGLSGTVTTAQTITGLSVSRYTGTESVGNEIWIEIYTAVGATLRTITASYTNEGNTSGRTTPAVPFGSANLAEAQRLLRLPLQAGDAGVRSVESVTISATTGTAGDFGVTIMRTLAAAQCQTTRQPTQRNLLGPDFAPIPIKTDACLFFYNSFGATSQAPINMLFLEA